MIPHLSIHDGGEVTLEWWCEERKLTLSFEDGAVVFVKVWGPNIHTEMSAGKVTSSGQARNLFIWLLGR